MQWQTELERRSVSATEVAREAGVHPVTAYRIMNGEREGAPLSRRKLWAALMEFPVIVPQTGSLDAPPAPSPELAASPAGRDPKVLLAELEGRRASWQ